jgi:hypothetical protein
VPIAGEGFGDRVKNRVPIAGEGFGDRATDRVPIAGEGFVVLCSAKDRPYLSSMKLQLQLTQMLKTDEP